MEKIRNRVIPITYDVVFKSVLQDKESEEYLKWNIWNIVFKNTKLKKIR